MEISSHSTITRITGISDLGLRCLLELRPPMSQRQRVRMKSTTGARTLRIEEEDFCTLGWSGRLETWLGEMLTHSVSLEDVLLFYRS